VLLQRVYAGTVHQVRYKRISDLPFSLPLCLAARIRTGKLFADRNCAAATAGSAHSPVPSPAVSGLQSWLPNSPALALPSPVARAGGRGADAASAPLLPLPSPASLRGRRPAEGTHKPRWTVFSPSQPSCQTGITAHHRLRSSPALGYINSSSSTKLQTAKAPRCRHAHDRCSS